VSSIFSSAAPSNSSSPDILYLMRSISASWNLELMIISKRFFSRAISNVCSKSLLASPMFDCLAAICASLNCTFTISAVSFASAISAKAKLSSLEASFNLSRCSKMSPLHSLRSMRILGGIILLLSFRACNASSVFARAASACPYARKIMAMFV